MGRHHLFFATVLLCSHPSAGTRAQEALYGKQPGHDAVFARFVNALDTPVKVTSNLLPPIVIGTGNEERIGLYQPVSDGKASLSIQVKTNASEIKDTIELEAGTSVTFLLRGDAQDRIQLISLLARSDSTQSRAILSFVNAAPVCGITSLMLEPKNAAIFADVPVDAKRSRTINPVVAELSAPCGVLGKAVIKLDRMQGGGAYSVWLLSLRGQPFLVLGDDRLPAWHP